ncbi:2-dehydro-3-deoxygalactonokinase [Thalassobius sp. Cn5-15]|uniref:2-dehydro-3-deoxygalactonokinase n=1 Tax=Thalassobius sp. Cn5-15 TaxID=2917763 RepID=UPI001EF3244B|nr:2-dehydro-3-deoxygalactonokinase [Thalassobius sp. Cn5-15]MCG7494899.1 2-dehydro-3-deoxygalactonokinase [Thalassobius sp. Cn5-15]
MNHSDWIGVVADHDTRLAWRFSGDTPQGVALADSAASRIIPFGGAASQPVPAKLICPVPGGALSQTQPLGLLPMSSRLALAGLCRVAKDFDGVACVVDGDQSHWVQISADEAVSFQSYLTPLLVRSLGAGDFDTLDADALSDTLSRPERLATQLSSAQLAENAGATIGHLLGAELAATKPYWLGQRVALVATGPLSTGYKAAFASQHLMMEHRDLHDLQQQGMIACNNAPENG